ncbi:MAG: hypothetical protein HYV77_04445 [Candidatus Wildermuthbacteria bacterium]|nr:hypothetical protein [Candidatus Wildermuthbacteria bacterium]
MDWDEAGVAFSMDFDIERHEEKVGLIEVGVSIMSRDMIQATLSDAKRL